ncbi:MAG: response regulator transcription factor [Bacteroidota bacterium]
MKQVINVIIVDDFKIITEGVAEMINEDEEIKVIGKADNRTKLFHHLKNQKRVDLILMDIEMPKQKFVGIEMTKEVKQLYPNVKVIILTQHNKEGMLNFALQNGADGFLLKSNATKYYLTKAIRSVAHKNLLIIDPEVKKGVVPAPSILSKREKQVACLLVDGFNERQISKQLGLAYYTVRSYTKEIRNKLAVTKNSLIVKYAVEHKICIS